MKVWMTVELNGEIYVGKKAEMTLDERSKLLESLCDVAKDPNYLQLETELGGYMIFPREAAARSVWTVHSEAT